MNSRAARQVLSLVQSHGQEAGAFQILERGYLWYIHQGRGCVGYVDTGRAWVAAGSPIAATGERELVAQAFVEAAQRARRRACFFGAEETFGSQALTRLSLGHQPEWDLQLYAARTLPPSLREQHRRARARGVTIRQAESHELSTGSALRQKLEYLVQRWVASRPMERLDFVVAVQPFTWEHLSSRLCCFVAERCDELLAATILLPVPRRHGWYLKHLLRDPTAPNGTNELLVHETLLRLAQEGYSYATLGLAPLSDEAHPALRGARRAFSKVFDFEGLCRFKDKLAPTRFAPIYLVHPEGSSAAVALLDSLRAFAPGGRLRFALATAKRQLRLAGRTASHRPFNQGLNRQQFSESPLSR